MNKLRNWRATLALLACSAITVSAASEKTLFEPSEASVAKLKTENGASASLASENGSPALELSFPKSGTYPGVDFPPPNGAWNLKEFGGIEATVTNNTSSRLGVCLRADNKGDWRQSPWNTKTAWISPGQTKKIEVTFGMSEGHAGYELDASQVSNIKVFVNKPGSTGSISIQDLKAIGTPGGAQSASGENFNAPPISGELFTVNAHTDLGSLKTNQSSVEREGDELKVTFERADYPNIQFPCPNGGWNLQVFKGIEVELKNVGDKKVRAAMRVDNKGSWKNSPWNTQMTNIEPGETKTLQLVFGEDNGSPGYPLDPRSIVGIQVFVLKPRPEATLMISDLKAFGNSGEGKQTRFSTLADRDKPVTRPDWVGKRPPVEGDWVMTLNEEFDGNKLNLDIWTPRLCWDGPAHAELQRYIEENITVEDGVMSIRCAKDPGHQYNDPSLPTREYATGAVTTLGKWTQKYGYIEAKIKLPTARGLWPAFWTMPDRGEETDLNIWARRDTKDRHGQGMEIDIFEHLTEWGSGRTNIATHWDGYGDDHKQWGNDHVYYGPTKDGWHVAGLLWEPGKLTWYIDGIKKGEWKSDRIIDVPSYLKFTVQMGNWATKNVDDAALPDYFKVDYVRAWQLAERLDDLHASN